MALRWLGDEKEVEFFQSNGVQGISVPGHLFAAAIIDEGTSGTNTKLAVLSANGSQHGIIDNSLQLPEGNFAGRFSWFEPAMRPEIGRFAAMFQTYAEGDFRCDIDAASLWVVSAIRVR